MLWIFTDNHYFSVSFDYLALFTDWFYGSSNFHFCSSILFGLAYNFRAQPRKLYKIFLAADCIVYEDADDYGYTVDRDASISNSSYLHRLDYLSAIRLMRDDLRRKLPETLDAVSLRYCATLASSVAIATMDSDPEVFGRVYSELVDARHDALSMRKLPFKSRAVYLLSYLGKETTRRSLSSFARRMTKETKAEEESPKG